MWTYNQNNLELYHHGIKGMRWGVRRYQNPDGTLTAAGKRRAARAEKKAAKKELNRQIDSKVRKEDVAVYGRARARRIAKRQITKGMTHKQAERREIGRGLAESLIATAISNVVAFDLVTGGAITKGIAGGVNKGKSKVSSIMKDHAVRNQTVEILGENGKVLKRYKHGWTESASTAGSLIRR